jgi:peptide-methionine (S)-S-oxide reductase
VLLMQIHDPTTPNRQGADVGPQYRSIILYTSEQQKETAKQVRVLLSLPLHMAACTSSNYAA